MLNTNGAYEKWILPDPTNIQAISEMTLPLEIKTLLYRRGLNTEDKINEFINPSPLPDPKEHFPDLEKAVIRIKSAINTKEKIAICGDYDADGMTSSALLNNVLSFLNANHEVLIPSRINEGYGLNKRMVEDLYSRNVKLIITVDNGVSAIDAIKLAIKYKIDVIITDHHKIQENINELFALIHPESTPSRSPYKCLAGVGLAYLISNELLSQFNFLDEQEKYLDLYCIGTIADMSPIVGANRALLVQALALLHQTTNKGISALINSSGIVDKKICTEDISFKIAPRINSIGRISDPKLIIQLLSEQNDQEINKLIEVIENVNSQRKKLCSKTEEEATNILENGVGLNNLFIIIKNSRWHSGVIGITASRLLEKYNKPIALLTSNEDGLYRASARAPIGFNLIDSLEQCKDLLESYGGHKAAAGFTICENNINILQDKLNLISENYSGDIYTRMINPDSYIHFSQINNHFINYLNLLEPYGVNNPQPLFWTRGVQVLKVINLGNSHKKLILRHNQHQLEAIHWSSSHEYRTFEYLDITFNIGKNYWNKRDSIQLTIKSVRSFQKRIKLRFGKKEYHCYKGLNDEINIENENGACISSSQIESDIKKFSSKSSTYLRSLLDYSKIAMGEAA